MTFSEIKKYKKKGRKIIFTWGCFDLLHTGHINFLSKSKKPGEILLVGVYSNEIVKDRKGKGRPIFSLSERTQLLKSLRCVDFVLEVKNTNLAKILEIININVDFAILPIERGREAEMKATIKNTREKFPKTKIRRIQYKTGISTTKIISKIKSI